jgi:hypothetical protein
MPKFHPARQGVGEHVRGGGLEFAAWPAPRLEVTQVPARPGCKAGGLLLKAAARAVSAVLDC